jgi:hypothetical protein
MVAVAFAARCWAESLTIIILPHSHAGCIFRIARPPVMRNRPVRTNARICTDVHDPASPARSAATTFKRLVKFTVPVSLAYPGVICYDVAYYAINDRAAGRQSLSRPYDRRAARPELRTRNTAADRDCRCDAHRLIVRPAPERIDNGATPSPPQNARGRMSQLPLVSGL